MVHFLPGSASGLNESESLFFCLTRKTFAGVNFLACQKPFLLSGLFSKTLVVLPHNWSRLRYHYIKRLLDRYVPTLNHRDVSFDLSSLSAIQ